MNNNGFFSYTAFNKASHISQGSLDYFITYGPDRLRRKTLLQSGLTEETLLLKYYALGDYEKETDASGTRHLHYITGGDGLAAIYVKNEGGIDSLYFIFKDHLGSIVGAINNETGNVYRQSFDAWGRNRNPENWTYSNVPDFIFDRGFTGHEHLKWFGLINMNGRMYDASLCRFLSPDPYVQMPDNSQNFNRYSYCLNNPLVYTDPSGEFIIEAMIIGALLNVAFQGLSGNIDNLGDGLMAAGIGALAGASGAYLAGAACVSMGLSATGVTSGVVWGGTAGLTSGFIGGAGNSWMNGSNFGDGLVDGLIGSAIGGITGGVLGGFSGGRAALNSNRNIWSGLPNSAKTDFSPMPLLNSRIVSPNRTPGRVWGTNGIIESPSIKSPHAITVEELNNRFANVMESLEGIDYVYDTDGPYSYDCSGSFCHGIRTASGTDFGDYSAHSLYEKFTMSINSPTRGSAYFYDWNSNGTIQHVVTNLDNGYIINPSSTSGCIDKVKLFGAGSNGKRFLRVIDWYKVFNIK